MAEESAPEPTEERQPRWGLMGIVAAATVVVAVLAFIGIRVLSSAPRPPLGETSAAELQLGSCLEEDAVDLDSYTVVDCSVGHPQQVIATLDMAFDHELYTEFTAMSVYAQEVCQRFLEYDLFVQEGVTDEDYQSTAIAVPSEEQFADGRTSALCAISPKDGSELTADLYRPMP